MAFKKKLEAQHVDTKARSVLAHAKFVQYVAARVEKIGIEKVLQQYQPALGKPTEYYWLKKAYEKVLNFAEQVQIKQIPVRGPGENGEFKLTIEIVDENNITPKSRNRISEFLEV